MRLGLLLVLAGAVAGTVHLWHGHQQAQAEREFADTYSQGPFIATTMPREATHDKVLIVAPVNCPSNAVRFRKSQLLARELDRLGIPNETTTNISFVWDPRHPEDPSEVFKSGPPIVFINGMAKANPSPDEIAEVFERTRSQTRASSEI